MRLFRKVFDLLAVGGLFILEPQLWGSYKRKYRRLSAKAGDPHLKPAAFPACLVDEVGFTGLRQVRPPSVTAAGEAAGFEQRPIYVMQKGAVEEGPKL